MEIYKLYTISYFIIACMLHVCHSECDEYVVLFKETSCGGNHTFTPINIDDINWNELTYPYNSTYDEIQGYKNYLLELNCENSSSSCIEKTKVLNQVLEKFDEIEKSNYTSTTNEASFTKKIDAATGPEANNYTSTSTEASVTEQTKSITGSVANNYTSTFTEASPTEQTETITGSVTNNYTSTFTEASPTEQTETITGSVTNNYTSTFTEASPTEQTETITGSVTNNYTSTFTAASPSEQTETITGSVANNYTSTFTEASPTEQTETITGSVTNNYTSTFTEASPTEQTETITGSVTNNYTSTFTEASPTEQTETITGSVTNNYTSTFTEASPTEQTETITGSVTNNYTSTFTEASPTEQTETIIGSVTNNYTSTFTEASPTEQTETITGSVTNNYTSTFTEASPTEQTETITGPVTNNYTSTFTEAIPTEQTETITGSVTNNYTSTFTEASPSEQTETITGSITNNYTSTFTEASPTEQTETITNSVTNNYTSTFTEASPTEQTETITDSVANDYTSTPTEASLSKKNDDTTVLVGHNYTSTSTGTSFTGEHDATTVTIEHDYTKVPTKTNFTKEINATRGTKEYGKHFSQTDMSPNDTTILNTSFLGNKDNETHEYETATPYLTKIVKSDELTYNVNIIYIYKREIKNSSKLINYEIKNKASIIHCAYAETVCMNTKNQVHNINITGHDKTTKTVEITLSQDKSTSQPIFTGDLAEMKIVTLSCKLKDNYKCKQTIKNTTIQTVSKPEYTMNIYFENNYIHNYTRTRYKKCTKDLDNTHKNALSLKCDVNEFTAKNLQILPIPQVNKISVIIKNETNTETLKTQLHDSLIWHCHITQLVRTKTSRLPTNEQQNDDNLIYFNDCSNSRNISNEKSYKVQKITLILNEKEPSHNNIKKTKYTELKITSTPSMTEINKHSLFITNKQMTITVYTANDRNDCSEIWPNGITEGKIIGNNIDFLENYNLELNLSNCIKNQSNIVNNRQSAQPTVMAIILNNGSSGTLNAKIFNKRPTETNTTIIVLQCHHSDFDLSKDSNKVAFKCGSMDYFAYKNTTELKDDINKIQITNASNKNVRKDILKQEIDIDSTKENREQTKIDTEHTKNYTTNKTENGNKCTTIECNILNEKESNNNIKTAANITNQDKNEEKDKVVRSKYNVKTRHNYMNSENLHNLPDEILEEGSTEKILLIVILAIAGISIVMVFTLRKCSNKEQYTRAAMREPPQDEETAL